jgi:hypothetical protein
MAMFWLARFYIYPSVARHLVFAKLHYRGDRWLMTSVAEHWFRSQRPFAVADSDFQERHSHLAIAAIDRD